MPGQDTKLRIYTAAHQLFYDDGFVDTTVANIISASETNKGSFYHHFEDKQHLAYNIYIEMTKSIDTQVKALFDLTVLQRLFLEECIFWRLFFGQPEIRRFCSEIFSISYIGVPAEYFDAILDMAPKDFTTRELLLIQGLELSLRSNFTAYVCAIVERLREEETIVFYLEQWLGLYQIPKAVIDKHLQESFDLMAALVIENDRFEVSLRPR
jgi:AcrR family transcriptional regulator